MLPQSEHTYFDTPHLALFAARARLGMGPSLRHWLPRLGGAGSPQEAGRQSQGILSDAVEEAEYSPFPP